MGGVKFCRLIEAVVRSVVFLQSKEGGTASSIGIGIRRIECDDLSPEFNCTLVIAQIVVGKGGAVEVVLRHSLRGKS